LTGLTIGGGWYANAGLSRPINPTRLISEALLASTAAGGLGDSMFVSGPGKSVTPFQPV
jgi:hypothetical protein